MDKIDPGGNVLLAGLPGEELAAVAAGLTGRRFEIGEILYRPGDTIHDLYFPVGGIISLVVDTDDGGTVEAATIGREGAAGVSTVLGGHEAAFRCIVQVAGNILVMSRRAMNGHLNNAPRFTARLLRYVDALMFTLTQNAACNALHTAGERCARWLLTTHDRVDGDEFFLTQEFLAQMLGVHRPTVTIAAGSLQQAGLIRYRRGNVVITDRVGLEEAACECYQATRDHFDAIA